MKISSHLQMNDTKLHNMGTLLVPILTTFALFSFITFIFPKLFYGPIEGYKFWEIHWGGVAIYPAAFIVQILTDALILTVSFLLLYKNERMSAKDFGLDFSLTFSGLKQFFILSVKNIIFLFLFFVLVFNFIQNFSGVEASNKIIFILHDWHRGTAPIQPIAPLFEEILFRGIYCTLLVRHGLKWSYTILVTGIAFGAFHVFVSQTNFSAYVIEISSATILGWFLGWIFYKTRTLVMPILWHYAVNGFICFAVLKPDLLKKFADFVIL